MVKRLFQRSKISMSTCNSKIRREKGKRNSNKTTQAKVRKKKILSRNWRGTKGFSITFQNMARLMLSCRRNCQWAGFSTTATFSQILSKKWILQISINRWRVCLRPTCRTLRKTPKIKTRTTKIKTIKTTARERTGIPLSLLSYTKNTRSSIASLLSNPKRGTLPKLKLSLSRQEISLTESENTLSRSHLLWTSSQETATMFSEKMWQE